ncbi:hypothetical protein TNCV_103521 [Trichonephila clavipes]|nr:hypothetical protein TNCV_103521 [Trichonephila clavipes]
MPDMIRYPDHWATKALRRIGRHADRDAAADWNEHAAWWLYQGRYTNSRVLYHMTFASVNRKLRETGSGHMTSLVYERPLIQLKISSLKYL